MLVVWPLMVAGTAAATYLIVTNNDLIIQRSGLGFAPLLMLSLVSIVSGILCTMSVLTEDWHPRMRTNVGPQYPMSSPLLLTCPVLAGLQDLEEHLQSSLMHLSLRLQTQTM